MQFKEYILPLVEFSQSSEKTIRICEMSRHKATKKREYKTLPQKKRYV